YAYQDKPIGSVAVNVLLAACVGLLAFLALRPRFSAPMFLTLAVVIGATMQFGFAYTEGRGFEGIRGRALAGHGVFIADALATRDPVQTLKDYNSLADSGKLGTFPRSKPPGTLLFYMLTVGASELVVEHSYDPDQRKNRFVDFLAEVWPFVAALAIVPLYWLTTMLAGPAEARLAAALYLLVPSFNLVTLHTDQVLFPSLYLTVLCLFVVSPRATQPAAFAVDTRPYPARLRSTAILATSMAAGVVVPSILLWLFLNYDPFVRWQSALAFHAAWRRVPAVLGMRDGLSNIAEFVDWTGVPIVLLACAVFWMRRAGPVPHHAVASGGDRRAGWSHAALMASLACLIGYLAFFSHTAAETARLWLFLMPVICVVAARTLAELRATLPFAAPLVFALQAATIYVIKVTHDFW
ncbi:MAG: hypothetical protein ABI652_08900, partial [Acidobacteriota bacterium]